MFGARGSAKLKGAAVVKEPMPQIKRILCPTDWSPPSRVALQCAVKMALCEDAELLLLHVLPALDQVPGIASPASLGRAVEKEARERLHALIDECVPPEVEAQVLVRVGEEAEEIHRAALEADVVVMSTHGRSAWEHWAFGSVAQGVLLEAACPIFAIGPQTAERIRRQAESDGRRSSTDFPYKQILWPTDWSESSESALGEALDLTARHGAEMLMLHVIEPPQPEADGSGDLADPIAQHGEAREQFRLLRERRPRTQGARRLISRGVAAAEIKRVAVAEGVDLIVMSTHGRTGWQPDKLGTVAQKVLRVVPCPVFLVPVGPDAPRGARAAEVQAVG